MGDSSAFAAIHHGHEPCCLVAARRGKELAVGAERNRLDFTVVCDAAGLATAKRRYEPRRLVLARGGKELAIRADRHCLAFAIVDDTAALAAIFARDEPRLTLWLLSRAPWRVEDF